MNKKKLKTTLIVLIILISLILFVNIGVYAANALASIDVSYTKPDGTSTNVKAALDELYADNPLSSAVSVGDKVDYKAGTSHSYKSPIGKTLEEKQINYVLVNRSENYEVEEKEECKNNKYIEYYNIAHKYVTRKNRINEIYDYLIENLNNDKIKEKITKIEEVLYEV